MLRHVLALVAKLLTPNMVRTREYGRPPDSWPLDSSADGCAQCATWNHKGYTRNYSEGGVLLGPERPRTYEDLSDTEKKRYDADVRATNIVLQADECDAFDSDVDDEPTAQTIFMANLSSVGSANPQAGPSNASILSEVHSLENVIDHSVTNQDEHEIHNVIPYEQYLSVNDISVVLNCASSSLNSICVSPINDAIVPHDPIAIELKIYKEQVAIYEQRAKFELTKREQRMNDQMRMLIQNCNKTEENLKKEIHSFKLQLKSTMENNKIIKETVTSLKHLLKQTDQKGPTGTI
ncbi:hypothetical protein Tco_0772045 [Tanacetum coccineum]|uniref:Uncharacterized protein n=1 Tax=Tanacetum coccineum TaxID=301880 RepID=A0ABQ4ZGU7_9ASTR